MKRIVKIIFLLLLVGLGIWYWQPISDLAVFLFESPCDRPIKYRLQRVDEEYDLSREEFGQIVEESTKVWGEAYHRSLFAYDPSAGLAVNLIYSDRQSALDELNRLEDNLSGGRSNLDSMIAEHRSLSAQFKEKLEKFNQEVAFWNEKGGAPFEVYERLLEEQKALEAEASRLNDLAQKLNLTVKEYNLEVSQYNRNVDEYNLVAMQKPEAGVFDGRSEKIDIYLTISRKELIHTLAHEFGHARGVEHIDDPGSLMYPFSSEVLVLSDLDRSALTEICRQKNWEMYLWQILQKYLDVE